MTSSVKNSIPQSVWWMTNHSAVPSSLYGDDQRADGIVAGATAGIADDVRVAFAEARRTRQGRGRASMQVRMARSPGRRQRQVRLDAERIGIGLVGGEDFVEDRGHRRGSCGVAKVGPGCDRATCGSAPGRVLGGDDLDVQDGRPLDRVADRARSGRRPNGALRSRPSAHPTG